MKHIWDKDLYRTNPIPIRLRGGKYMSQEEGRKNDNNVLGSFNRAPGFGSCRGCIFTVELLDGMRSGIFR